MEKTYVEILNTTLENNLIFNAVNTNNKKINNELINLINYEVKVSNQNNNSNNINIFSKTNFTKNVNSKLIIPRLDSFDLKNYKNYTKKTNNWIGHINSISENSFTAKLHEIRDNGTYEIAEFDFEEISNEDLSLIKVGAAFYWSIGHNVRNGQITKESIIRFQRLPQLNENEFEDIMKSVDELYDFLSN